MAKARRQKTRYPNVYKVGARFEWVSKRSRTRGMADTAKEARDCKADADSRGEPLCASARGTFGTHARDWLPSYQGRTSKGFSESTRRRYRDSLELWAIPYFDEVRPRKFAEVRKPDVRAFITWLGQQQSNRGRPLTRATIQRTITPVKAMYADAIEDGTLNTANPATVRVNTKQGSINPDEGDGDGSRAFTHEELEAILDAARERDRLLLDFLVETGLRWGEACEVRGRDLKSFDSGPRLCVRRAYSTHEGVVKWPKSDFGRRDIPLSPSLARRLWRLQRTPNELLFVSPQGKRLNYSNTRRRMLLPLLKAAGIQWGACFHGFRHTCASLLFASGRNVKQVQRWLGHHKASFTLDTYIKLIDDDIGEALDLDAVFAAGGTRGAPKLRQTDENTAHTFTAKTAGLQG
jgi:integrase